jgi:hypothetical protein
MAQATVTPDFKTEQKVAELQQAFGLHNIAKLWEEVKNYKSEAAIEHYAREFGFDIAEATMHFEELLKYLCLSASYAEPLTPSVQLDQMWHAFLIQTLDYKEFSHKLGKFVNHSTMSRPQSAAYSNVLLRYKQNFGELHPVWLSPKLNREENECPECEIVGWCSDNTVNECPECEIVGWCSDNTVTA